MKRIAVQFTAHRKKFSLTSGNWWLAGSPLIKKLVLWTNLPLLLLRLYQSCFKKSFSQLLSFETACKPLSFGTGEWARKESEQAFKRTASNIFHLVTPGFQSCVINLKTHSRFPISAFIVCSIYKTLQLESVYWTIFFLFFGKVTIQI